MQFADVACALKTKTAIKRAAKQLLRSAVQKILKTNRPLFRFHLHLFCMFKYIAQTAVFCRHGNDDRPQLLLQSTAARQNLLLAVVDLRKGVVYHVQQKGLLGGVNGVDGLFADV